jgi:hypothetical protein
LTSGPGFTILDPDENRGTARKEIRWGDSHE